VTPANPWLAKLLEFTEGLAALSAGRFPVALALMRGPLDLLSALRGPERMVFDLFDEPQAVDRDVATPGRHLARRGPASGGQNPLLSRRIWLQRHQSMGAPALRLVPG
jgi:hypothetical protein